MTEDQLWHLAKCLDNGCSPRLAEMLALGQPPMSNTDREFLEGRCNGNQFESQPQAGNYYKRVAEEQGQNTKGKVYLSGLAEYPGDPRAWVAGRGDAQKVCEERGWGCEGSVSVKLQKVAEANGPYRVADSIVEDRVLEMQEASVESGAGPLDLEATTHEARTTLSPNWK